MPRVVPPLKNVKLIMWSNIDDPGSVRSACRPSPSHLFSLTDGRMLSQSRLFETLANPEVRIEVIHRFPQPLDGVQAFYYTSVNHKDGIMVRMNEGLWTPLRLDARGRTLEVWQRGVVGEILTYSPVFAGDIHEGPV